MARVLDSETGPPRPDVRARELFLRVMLLGAGVTLLGALGGVSKSPSHLLLSIAPLAPLAWGLVTARRGQRADGWLLFGVPAACAVSQPYAPDHVDPIFFCTWSIVLVGYMVQAARMLSLPTHAVHKITPGRSADGKARLVQRARFYDAMLALSVLAFVTMIVRALTSGGRPVVAMAAAGMLAVLATRAFFIDALDRHVQRDPALAQSLERLRKHARRGRPDATFYVIAIVALIAMIVFVLRERLL